MEQGKEEFARWLNEWLRKVPRGNGWGVPRAEVTIDVAATDCHMPVDLIVEYVREDLLIPLNSNDATLHFTDLDYLWISTLKRLQDELHLSYEQIRRLIVGWRACWRLRNCEFHNTQQCPITSDPSKPCWVNRAAWQLLASYRCYSCLAYRVIPYCADGKTPEEAIEQLRVRRVA